MLTVVVPGQHLYDELHEKFIDTEDTTLELEHSLVSLSKWESKWEIPFLGTQERTDAQTIDYVKCMILNNYVSDEVFNRLTSENYRVITDYINKKMTATWFSDKPSPGVKEIVTAEVIYYWLVALQIPFECQYWHLSKLLALVKVINLKNAPEKKMSKAEQASRMRDLNAQRRAQMGTDG